jgi:hypothetical protein
MSNCFIPERSNIIPISPSSPTNKKENEYSLKENLFDPSKSSPPNTFMKKLRLRMTIYNSYQIQPFIKEDNREIE